MVLMIHGFLMEESSLPHNNPQRKFSSCAVLVRLHDNSKGLPHLASG